MDETALLAALGGFIVVVGIIALVLIVLTIVANWKIYEKAGEAGWKSIIPYYSAYTRFSFSFNITPFFWVFLCASILNYILNGRDGFLGAIGTLVGIVYFVVYVAAQYFLARSFGQGVGFTVGLVLLPTIFTLILGFGSAQYVGNGYESFMAERNGGGAA